MINIAGAFSKYNILLKFLILNNLKIVKQNQICVYDSFENSPWNGGRIANLLDLKDSIDKIIIYNSYNIGVYITFSNYRIDNLQSKNENNLLNFLNNNTLNGCIIGNAKLRDYIRLKYPNLKLIKSVTSFDTTDLSKVDWTDVYKYDYFCPRFEWTFNEEFYEHQDISKAEILVNDCCKRDCTFWKKHFEAIADANRLNITDKKELEKIQSCWLNADEDSDGFKTDNQKFPELSGMLLSINDLKIAKSIGYTNFKISGRDRSNTMYFDELIEYFNILTN